MRKRRFQIDLTLTHIIFFLNSFYFLCVYYYVFLSYLFRMKSNHHLLPRTVKCNKWNCVISQLIKMIKVSPDDERNLVCVCVFKSNKSAPCLIQNWGIVKYSRNKNKCRRNTQFLWYFSENTKIYRLSNIFRYNFFQLFVLLW